MAQAAAAVEVQDLSSCDVNAEHDVSALDRLDFDGRLWQGKGSSIGALLLHMGMSGGWTMDLVRFLGQPVVEEVVVEIDDGIEGGDVYCDALDTGLLEYDGDLWPDMDPGVDSKVPKEFRQEMLG
jgi:hypothetical protein